MNPTMQLGEQWNSYKRDYIGSSCMCIFLNSNALYMYFDNWTMFRLFLSDIILKMTVDTTSLFATDAGIIPFEECCIDSNDIFNGYISVYSNEDRLSCRENLTYYECESADKYGSQHKLRIRWFKVRFINCSGQI